MPSHHLILCHPLLLLPPIPPGIRVFSNGSTLHMKWPNYWSFSFSISPSNEHPGLISFRMDWLDLLAVQGTLKSLVQHHSSKASILRCSIFFTVQPTSIHDHWKNHSLDQTDLCWQRNVSAAAAKSLQLCSTLCNPMEGSLPGSPILGILQARTLEWVAIAFSVKITKSE